MNSFNIIFFFFAFVLFPPFLYYCFYFFPIFILIFCFFCTLNDCYSFLVLPSLLIKSLRVFSFLLFSFLLACLFVFCFVCLFGIFIFFFLPSEFWRLHVASFLWHFSLWHFGNLRCFVEFSLLLLSKERKFYEAYKIPNNFLPTKLFRILIDYEYIQNCIYSYSFNTSHTTQYVKQSRFQIKISSHSRHSCISS